MKNDKRVCAPATALPIPPCDQGRMISPRSSVKRREALKATACSFASMALPSLATGSSDLDTPILRLFRKSRKLRNYIDTTAREDEIATDEYLNSLAKRMWALEDHLMALPSECAADVVAKILVKTSDGLTGSEWELDPIWIEARDATGITL